MRTAARVVYFDCYIVPTTLMSDRVFALISGDAMSLEEGDMLFHDAEMP